MNFSEWIILRTGGQTWYNYLTTYISVDLAHHEIFRAEVVKGGFKCILPLLKSRNTLFGRQVWGM